MRWLIVALALLVSGPAWSQQATPVDRAVMLSLQLQRAGVEAQDMAVQLRAAMNRVSEIEKLCGDPCKAKAAKPEPEAK